MAKNLSKLLASKRERLMSVLKHNATFPNKNKFKNHILVLEGHLFLTPFYYLLCLLESLTDYDVVTHFSISLICCWGNFWLVMELAE